MRARPPSTRVDPAQLTVVTELVTADGSELPTLELTVPRAHADLLDTTATPALPALVTAAVLRGEDLEVEGSVDVTAAQGATALAGIFAEWWDLDPIRVEVASTYEAPSGPGGVGLFFTRGVDSCSTLLDLLDEPAGDRVTHLLSVHHGLGEQRPVEAEIIDGHRAVADELDLSLVVLSTNVRALLDPHRPWGDTFGPALVSTGLVAAAGLRRLVLAGAHPASVHTRTGADPDLLDAIGTGRTEVIFGNPRRDRDARLVHLLGTPRARQTLQVCWEGMTAGNCGRCLKCQHTMAGLLLAGDADPTTGFDGPLDPALVRGQHLRAQLDDMVRGLREDLPPEHEELRRAWADAWLTSHGDGPPVRWGTDDPPPLAGPSVATRVAAGLRTASGQADHPAPVPLCWRPGAAPLRPALADHHLIRARAADHAERIRPWAVVEPHIRDARRDGHQADLALRCQDAFGPGPCYLPGILWAWEEPPVLDPSVVAALLGTVRARLWWRSAGDLEAIRLVETLEHGCLPLQVMPSGPARDLADALPPPLAPLVIADNDLPGVDLSPAATAALLGPALDHLLAGSADHDLIQAAHR
ncbi:hypothetical protein BH24ACT4_BH24ACT4_12970 [soil metagenome]